ncbi:MAG: hypothetical protein R3E67_03750 [Pseudomonadales bacterium]
MIRTLISLIFVLAIGLPLTACSTGSQGMTGKAAQQQERADQLADEYLDCVHDLIEKTSREKYADRRTRRNVVLDSCQSTITPFTVVQEQAFSNACVNSGKSNSACDDEAVSKARRETDKLEQKARERVDAAPMPYY